MNKNKIFLTLISIFSISFFLRLYHLDLLPLYADETGHYFYYYIVRGTPPLTIIGLVDYFYRAIFSLTWLAGLNPLGVRLSSAIFSSLISVFAYIVAVKVSKNKILSLLFSLLIALMPWNFMVSRIGHTHIPLLVSLVLLHIYFYLCSDRIRDHLISLFILGLCLLIYPSFFVIVPIASLSILLGLYQKVKETHRPALIILVVLISSLAFYLVNQRFDIFSTTSRGMDLAIWRDVNTPYDTDKYRALSWNSQPSLFSFGLPPEQLANKLFLNRITANLSIFTRNYLSFFSPDWLFLKGDAILRHSTGLVGAFYPFLLPFMLYGAFRFFKDAEPKTRNLFLVWILVSPIPAALTKDGAGYLLRAVTMLPFLTYFCALGIVDSFSLISRKWRLSYGVVIALIGLYSAWSFFYGYFHVYPALSARAYEYGFKELSDFQAASGGKTMLIVWDGYYPVGHFLFWQKVPFSEYEKMKITPIGIGETTFWKTLPNLYFTVPKDTKNVAQFIKDYQPAYLVLPDRYFVKYSDDLLKLTAGKIYEIPYPDKTTAFSVYTLK